MAAGFRGYSDGYVSDQTQLLQDIVDGLVIYNKTANPLIDNFCMKTTREIERVSQSALDSEEMPDGGTVGAKTQTYRLITNRFKSYLIRTGWTSLGLQDALPSDVQATLDGAMAGDAQRLNTLFFQAIFKAYGDATAINTVGTASSVGFYHGETDVSDFKNTTFNGVAQDHYTYTASTTLGVDNIDTLMGLVRGKGYGLMPGALTLFANTAQAPDIQAIMDPSSGIAGVTPNRVSAIDDGVQGNGIRVRGCNVVIDNDVPSGFVALVANDVKPISMREHIDPAYRGLLRYQESFDQNFPLANSNFLRRVGFTVRHMGAGAVIKLNAGSYANPTFRL